MPAADEPRCDTCAWLSSQQGDWATCISSGVAFQFSKLPPNGRHPKCALVELRIPEEPLPGGVRGGR